MFVAVWPDDSTVEQLSALELGSTEDLRVVGPAQFHVTLRFLGEVDIGFVPDLVGALENAAVKLPPSIHCRVGPSTAWFGGDRVLQVPVSGLVGAARAVRAATLPVVPDPDQGDLPFSAHVTVARSRRRRLAGSARTARAGIPVAAAFEVGSFDLVVSQPTAEGPRYETRARLPLGG